MNASLRVLLVPRLNLWQGEAHRRSHPPTPRALHLRRRRPPVVLHHVPSLAVGRPPPPRRRRQRRRLVLEPAPVGVSRAPRSHGTRLVLGHGRRVQVGYPVVYRRRRPEHRGGSRVGHHAVTASDAYVATDSRVALLDFSHLSLGGTQPAELGIQPRERRHERSLLDATTPAHAGVDVR